MHGSIHSSLISSLSPARQLFARTLNHVIFEAPPTLVCKRCLLWDLEDFDFLHLEIERTGENHSRVDCSVVDVSVAKISPSLEVCVAVIGNTDRTRPFVSAFWPNLLAGMLCGFFSVKTKFVTRPSSFTQLFSFPKFPFHLRDSHSTGITPPFEGFIF
jgi:hypothetical protein